jgi:hypothetical protein
MRSTQVAAAWVPCLFQGPDSHPPARLKFLKLLISNTGSGSPQSPAVVSPIVGGHFGAASSTKSAESDDSGSGETDSGSAFSSPEAARPVPRLSLGKTNALPSTANNASSMAPMQVSVGHSEAVQDLLKECRGVMQVPRLDPVTSRPVFQAFFCSRHFAQAFLKSNQDLSLKMSEMQAAQQGSSPSASGIGDLRRELDEANEERVQVYPPPFVHVCISKILSPSTCEILVH